jgi:hypothetical protein
MTIVKKVVELKPLTIRKIRPFWLIHESSDDDDEDDVVAPPVEHASEEEESDETRSMTSSSSNDKSITIVTFLGMVNWIRVEDGHCMVASSDRCGGAALERNKRHLTAAGMP